MRYGVVLIALVCLFSCEDKKNKVDLPISYPEIISDQSAIGTEDDPQARLAYELNLVKNPRTGKPNPSQRKKELRFVEKMKFSGLQRPTETQEWTLVGPDNVGGRTRAIGIDVLDENVLLAGGVSGGIWKSENFGESWRRTSDPILLNSITTLVQDKRAGHENEWYYGSGELRGGSARIGDAVFRGDGVFKSTDNGESWDPLVNTSEFANGSEFTSQFQFIWNMAVNNARMDIDEVLLAAFGGILRSEDGGTTWRRVLGEDLINPGLNLNSLVAPFYTDIALTSDGRYFATMSTASISESYEPGGIYHSLDGINWEEISPPELLLEFDRIVMGVSPSNEEIVYFLVDERTSSDRPQLWRLNFDGSDVPLWTNLSNNIPEFEELRGDFDTQDSYNMTLKVHPLDVNTVYIGAANLYRSTDGFTSTDNTSWIGGYDPDGSGGLFTNHHPDQHVIDFLPSNPNILLSGNDGGIFVTNNNLAEPVIWSSLNNSFVTSQFYSIAQQQDEANNLLIGGLQDNGTYIRPDTDSRDWVRLLGGDGTFTYITKERRSWYFSTQNSRIFRGILDDNFAIGSRFARIDPVGGGDGFIRYLFVNPFVIDPEQETIMYLAGGDRIWRNDNLEQVPLGSNDPTTANWTSLNNTVTVGIENGEVVRTDGQVTALDLAKGPTEVLYFGTSNGQLFAVSKPQIDTSPSRNITASIFPEGAYIANITVNQDNPNELLVIFSSHQVRSVFRSTDGGDTFTDVSGNLEEDESGVDSGPSARWSEIVPLTNGDNRYFVGTSAGVFSTSQLDVENVVWEREGETTIGTAVIRMMDYRPLDGRLVVATHGNGVFETFIENQKVPQNLFEEFDFALENVFPNPMGPQSERVRIVYTFPETTQVRVDLLNTAGQLVDVIFFGEQGSGKNQVFWDGTNSSGERVANGTYYYSIRLENRERIGGIIAVNR